MNTQTIKEIVGEFLRKMGVSFEEVVEDEDSSSGTRRFVIKTPESGILIGAKGANFSALNHLIKKIISKRTQDREYKFVLDINGYGKKIADELTTKVVMLRQRAISLRADIELDPMSPYERMLVHSMCEGVPNIKTESKGEGANRRVVIKFIESEPLP